MKKCFFSRFIIENAEFCSIEGIPAICAVIKSPPIVSIMNTQVFCCLTFQEGFSFLKIICEVYIAMYDCSENRNRSNSLCVQFTEIHDVVICII